MLNSFTNCKYKIDLGVQFTGKACKDLGLAASAKKKRKGGREGGRDADNSCSVSLKLRHFPQSKTSFS
jgi:hypothetical protein